MFILLNFVDWSIDDLIDDLIVEIAGALAYEQAPDERAKKELDKRKWPREEWGRLKRLPFSLFYPLSSRFLFAPSSTRHPVH